MSVATDYLKNVYELLTVSELTLNNYIFTEKVLKTINRLLNEKIAGSDRISNKVLKRIILIICTDLIQGIYTAFMCSLLLTYYKELITVILYKKGKKNYLLSKSFRLITLKNMLAKIVKKILTIYLSCTVEEYSLLS